jgi:putative transposase
MNKKDEPKLEYNTVYLIYNCGINGCNLFISDEDYEHFLSKYALYIDPIADTYAWSLLGNHFHLVIRIKKESEIRTLAELGLFDKKATTKSVDKKPEPTRQFSHLFNSHAQYFNNKYKRHGSLFERPFHKKLIDHPTYFKRCLIYVHQNPVHHGFVENISEYKYTSYNIILSGQITFKQRETVLKLFDNLTDFMESHNKPVSFEETFDNE